MRRHYLKLLLLPIIFLFISPFSFSYGKNSPIRVAFVPYEGFYTIDEMGEYSGYNYEYLVEIAQHTGWDYEFVIIEEDTVEESLEISSKMLQNGEVDLLGSIYASEENLALYEFGDQFYGVARSTICSLSNNNEITKDTYFARETIHAALVQGEEVFNGHFFQIMESYGIEPEVTYVSSQNEAVDLLTKEKVDVIMSSNISNQRVNLVSLASQNPTPFYFVSTKGNTDLIDELDRAIEKIKLYDPTITERLQERYFETENMETLLRTKRENEALKEYNWLNVGLVRNLKPYSFDHSDDPKEVQGISKEMLDLLSDTIDVEFRYVWVDSFKEMAEKIASGEIDICGTMNYDYDLGRDLDVSLSQAFLASGAVNLKKEGDFSDTFQVYQYFTYGGIPDHHRDQVTTTEDISTLLEEISNNGGISLYCDPHIAQYYVQLLGLENVETFSVTGLSSYTAIGVANRVDPIILGLINRGIQHLDPFNVEQIVYHNVIVQQGVSLQAFLDEHGVALNIFVIISLGSIVFTLAQYATKLKKITRQDSMTKLINSGHFHHYAGKRTKVLEKGCLILLDIDYFKQVNDTYGHQKGDEVIMTVAGALKSHFRKNDMVARLGGDEFAVLLENPCKQSDLDAKFQALQEALEDNASGIPVALSVGGIIFSKPTNFDELYQLADKNLYIIKEKGRNGYLFTQQ